MCKLPKPLTGLIAGIGLLSSLQAQNIDFLNVEEMTVNEACRMISFATGQSITPTSTSRDKICSVLVRNASIEEAISKVCVSSGLVYRRDNVHGGFLVMSIEEYQENIIVSAGEKVRVFDVDPANVQTIARAIQSLYPEDAILEESEGITAFDEPVETIENENSQGGFGQSGGFGGGASALGGRPSSNNFRGASGFGGGFGNRGGLGGQFGGNNRGNDLTQIQAIETETTSGTETEEKAPSASAIYVTTNLEHSQIVVRTANQEAILQIEELVQRLDKPVSQVLLEMQILSLDIGDNFDTGVGLGVRNGATNFTGDIIPITPAQLDDNGNLMGDLLDLGNGTALSNAEFLGRRNNFQLFNVAAPASSSFLFQYLSEEVNARLNFLASDNNVEVIASPMLVATNGREAEINVGEERVIITGASSQENIASENGTINRNVQVETEVRVIGTSLRIIPRINRNDTVTMHVQQASTTLNPGSNSIPISGTSIPIDSVNTAEIEATVVAKDKNTIAVGGLIRSEQSKNKQKIPILGDVPVLGRAFSETNDATRKTELILVITPHIMRSGSDSRLVTDSILSQHSDHSAVYRGGDHLNRHNKALLAHRKAHGRESEHAHGGRGLLPPKPAYSSHQYGSKGGKVAKVHTVKQQQQPQDHYNDVKRLPQTTRKKFFSKRKR